MKIGIVGVISKKITSHPLGGTEAFTYLLIDQLVKRGHDVTLYCAKGSETPAQRHVEICAIEEATSLESNVEFIYPYMLLEIKKVIEDVREKKFDLIHVNLLKTFLVSHFADQIDIPIIHTIHRDFFENRHIADLYKKIGIHNHEYFVLVSKRAQQTSLIKNNIYQIYNGINSSIYNFSPQGGEKFLWLSRIDPLKGPKEAILAAKNTGVKLMLSGDIDRKKYEEYFKNELESLLTERITYEKPVSLERNLSLFHNAKALLFPIQWEEPFPLVVLESMSCGVPVIAFARGSLPESIIDGETGFLVNPSNNDIRGNWVVKKTGIEGISEAIQLIQNMPNDQYLTMRKKCRKRVEDYFTIEQMAENYEKLYEKIIENKSA